MLEIDNPAKNRTTKIVTVVGIVVFHTNKQVTLRFAAKVHPHLKHISDLIIVSESGRFVCRTTSIKALHCNTKILWVVGGRVGNSFQRNVDTSSRGKININMSIIQDKCWVHYITKEHTCLDFRLGGFYNLLVVEKDIWTTGQGNHNLLWHLPQKTG